MKANPALAHAFHALHHAGQPLVLPNIWDPLGALLLQDLGYKAVATSSSAMANVLGLPDGERMPFDELLASLERIVCAVGLPVSADIESGHAQDARTLEQNIAALIDRGIVGLNIEDSGRDGRLVAVEEQVAKIKLVRRVADQAGVPLFVNARVDTYVHGGQLDHQAKLVETIRRGKAYREAGAHCLFPILLNDAEHIRAIKEAVPLPLNIMVYGQALDMPALRGLGVERISMGGSLLKVALHAMRTFAEGARNLLGTEAVRNNPVTSAYIEQLIARPHEQSGT